MTADRHERQSPSLGPPAGARLSELRPHAFAKTLREVCSPTLVSPTYFTLKPIRSENKGHKRVFEHESEPTWRQPLSRCGARLQKRVPSPSPFIFASIRLFLNLLPLSKFLPPSLLKIKKSMQS